MTGADLLALIKKQPIAFLCGVIVIASAAALFLRGEAVNEAQALFQAKDTEANKTEANARHTAGLAEATAEMQEVGKQFDGRLLRAPQLANNLQFFYRLEADTGVKLLDVRQNPIPAPKQGAPRPTYVGIPFTANVQGNFAQVYDFIRRVEAGPHFLRFNQLTLSKLAPAGGAGGAPDAMTAQLQVEILGTP
ncbi:MAG: hypothetical protein C0518_12020 [Opitutus sp.]|nr:hypothetical protein [Opitutus sp.]